MATKTIVTCDVKTPEHEGVVKSMKMSIVFTTETTEGRGVTPYLTTETLDICSKCLQRIVDTRTLLTGHGAQGYNDYYFEGATND